MQAERDGVSIDRVRECLDAVLWATQQADQHTSYVCMALPVMDDVARVLEEVLARPATPGDGAVGLAGEVANLQARLAASEAERCKMADTAVAGWLEHNRMRWDAEERATAAEARAEAAEDRFRRLLIAFHDATRRQLGVTPASGDEFYDWRLAEAAEERRPRYGTDEERQERPEAKLVRTERALDEALRIGAEQADRLAALAVPQPSGAEATGQSESFRAGMSFSESSISADLGEPGRAQPELRETLALYRGRPDSYAATVRLGLLRAFQQEHDRDG